MVAKQKPPLNRVEVCYCIGIVVVVAILSLFFVTQGAQRQVADQQAAVFWSRIFLGLWLIGLAIEIRYFRVRINGIMMTCILIGLFLWAFFGSATFPIKDRY